MIEKLTFIQFVPVGLEMTTGTDHGLRLFANIVGNGFVPQVIDLPELEDMQTMSAALLDLNNDGWLDIFASGFRKGNHVVFSNNGRFNRDGYRRLPDTGATITKSVAFADLDRDGDLDALLGNITSEEWTWFPPESSRNVLMWNDGEAFRIEMLPSLPGETKSSLISDINGDDRLDFVIGNDFSVSDYAYLGQPGGGVRIVKRGDDYIQHTTWSTMSVDTADINNDLVLEMYIGQITGMRPGQFEKQIIVTGDKVCDGHTDEKWKDYCLGRWRLR